MNQDNRRLGLEQEFFLVDAEGVPSNRADDFLEAAKAAATEQGLPDSCFAPEFVKNMVEINTIPAQNLTELTQEYLKILKIALAIAKQLDLRLYPLSTYPLHLMPVMRDKLNYHLQGRTVGRERFKNAGKCIGTHLHLELPAGIIDRTVGIAYGASAEARAETLNLYNLLTALDTALIALSRACPFFEGQVDGMATRTVHYRGSDYFGWEGVYTYLQPVGGLMPYADRIEDLIVQHFHRYYTWLEAMDRADIERHLFWESGGEFLTAGWNPLRLNRLGTVELRGMDSNYPERTLALITLVVSAANRVRQEGLTVKPQPDLQIFEWSDSQLNVPDFNYLNGELLYGAVTEGVNSKAVALYLDSILEFVCQGNDAKVLSKFRTDQGSYRTTEADLLQAFPPVTEHLSRQEGLHLVRHCCDQLEAQVEQLSQKPVEQAIETSLDQVLS